MYSTNDYGPVTYDNDNDNEMILLRHKHIKIMHNYTVIIRKSDTHRKHIQRLCIVTN